MHLRCFSNFCLDMWKCLQICLFLLPSQIGNENGIRYTSTLRERAELQGFGAVGQVIMSHNEFGEN